MSEGEFKKRIDPNSANYDILSSEVLAIIEEAKKELLTNPNIRNYEEIAVPDAWEPWFKKWFGEAKKLDEEEYEP